MGKLFFRRQSPWAQRRKMVVVLWCIIVGLLSGGVIVALTLYQNAKN